LATSGDLGSATSGDFSMAMDLWHFCPEHGRKPTVNSSNWAPKFERTRFRGERNTAALEAGRYFGCGNTSRFLSR
jgi:hypothetical protein